MGPNFGKLIRAGLCVSASLSLLSFSRPVSGLPAAGAKAMFAQTAADLWVDATAGSDSNDGLSPGTALRTIQEAASRAGPGTTVRIMPGVYRESVFPAADGTLESKIAYVAAEGPGTVVVRGSEPSSSLVWHQLSHDPIGLPADVDPTNIYYADLGGWDLADSPRFVIELGEQEEVAGRLPLARKPNWDVETGWRYHELWWTADGGRQVAQCDPSDPQTAWDCDIDSRCNIRLTDVSHYPEPDPRIEDGDLTSLGNGPDGLTGARLVALDTKWGHYLYTRRIEDHDVAAGRVTVDGDCLQDGGPTDPGLGWGSKYYVEDHPALLDSPGEWWYDGEQGRLYLWPPAPGDPADMAIEISRRDDGVDLTDRSHITLDGLTIELFNENAVRQGWGGASEGNTVRNATLRYANYGVVVLHSGDGVTRDFLLEDSEIAHIDSSALFISEWWAGAPSATLGWEPSISDIVIRGNEMHDLGFRADTDNAIGVKIQFPNELRFEENHIHNVAHNGLQLLWSVIVSDNERDFAPHEIKTGGILIKDNVIEEACQLTTDCAALKFWGQPPHSHVFRDVLVTGNVLRNNRAWTYVAEQRSQNQRGWWIGGEASGVAGRAGFGLYLDFVSGIHAYRNVIHNNPYAGFMLVGTWRDGDIVFYNNVVADSLYGIRPTSPEHDAYGGSVNTRIANNIIATSEGYGIYQCTGGEDFGNMVVDHNLYFNAGWRAHEDGGVWEPGAMAVRTWGGQQYYPTVADIRAYVPGWEAGGDEGDPHFARYDPLDHNPDNSGWADFALTPDSTRAIGRGAELPASLSALLDAFGVADPRWGGAWDIGRYEGAFVVSVSPSIRSIDSEGVALYRLLIESVGEFASTVTLNASTAHSCLDVTLDRSEVTEDSEVTLMVTDTGCAEGELYAVQVTASAGGFTRSTAVGLILGGSQAYLPLILRGGE